MSSGRKKDSKKDDEGVIFIGGKCFTLTKNFAWWLFVGGVIFLLLGLACLYVLFNPPRIDYFFYGYIGWLQYRYIYLYLAIVAFVTSAASFIRFVYEKYIKDKSKRETHEG